MILGQTVFYGIFLVFANMIVDIAYGFVDPRIRLPNKGGIRMATKKIESQEKVITADLFRTVGKSVEEMEAISRPSLTFWQEAWLRICKDKAAFIGLIILTVYVILAIFAPMVSRYEFDQQDAYAIKQSFSAEHWFGTDFGS